MLNNYLSLEKGFFHIITGPNGTGKSRMLTELSELALRDINKKYSKIICLAGTVYERFKIPSQNPFDYDYCYLGQKINYNMFSELAPYRNLFKLFCHDYREDIIYDKKLQIISALFKLVGFDGFIGVKLRNQKGKGSIVEYDKYHCIFFNEEEFKSSISNLKGLLEDACSISNITFLKNGVEYNLNELSSGERSILLMILGVTLIIKDDCIIFYDEPENSMHPKWQEYIISFLQEILKLSCRSTVVIATHSPLVVSSVTVHNKKIINLGEKKGWRDSDDPINSNIETTLYKVFNKITPQSHLLSIEISKVVKDMLDENISEAIASRKLNKLREAGLDDIQNELIDAVISNLNEMKNNYDRID